MENKRSEKLEKPVVSKFAPLKKLKITGIPGEVEVLPNKSKKGEMVVSIWGPEEKINSITLSKQGDKLVIVGGYSGDDDDVSDGQCNNITQIATGSRISQSVIVNNGSVVSNCTQSAFSCGSISFGMDEEKDWSCEEDGSLKIQVKVPKDTEILIKDVSKKINVKDHTGKLAIYVGARKQAFVGKIVGDMYIEAGRKSEVDIESLIGDLMIDAGSKSSVSVKTGKAEGVIVTVEKGGNVYYGGSTRTGAFTTSLKSLITVEKVTSKEIYEDKSAGGEIIINKRE